MQLTEKQKIYLRGLAHDLRPVILVGSGGITSGLIAELDRSLEHHELVKVRVRIGNRDACRAAIENMAEQSRANLVTRIGNTAVLYRQRVKNPGIELP